MAEGAPRMSLNEVMSKAQDMGTEIKAQRVESARGKIEGVKGGIKGLFGRIKEGGSNIAKAFGAAEKVIITGTSKDGRDMYGDFANKLMREKASDLKDKYEDIRDRAAARKDKLFNDAGQGLNKIREGAAATLDTVTTKGKDVGKKVLNGAKTGGLFAAGIVILPAVAGYELGKAGAGLAYEGGKAGAGLAYEGGKIGVGVAKAIGSEAVNVAQGLREAPGNIAANVKEMGPVIREGASEALGWAERWGRKFGNFLRGQADRVTSNMGQRWAEIQIARYDRGAKKDQSKAIRAQDKSNAYFDRYLEKTNRANELRYRFLANMDEARQEAEEAREKSIAASSGATELRAMAGGSE